MSIYKNIDGTSKKSFRIGSRGVVLQTDSSTNNPDALKRLLVDGNAVYTEGNVGEIFIERRFISEWYEKDNTVTLVVKSYSEEKRDWVIDKIEIKSSTSSQGIQLEGKAQENNFATFGTDGKTLKDSGFHVLSDIVLQANGLYEPNDNPSVDETHQIPTFGVVRKYVEGQARPIAIRQTGATAQKLN